MTEIVRIFEEKCKFRVSPKRREAFEIFQRIVDTTTTQDAHQKQYVSYFEEKDVRLENVAYAINRYASIIEKITEKNNSFFFKKIILKDTPLNQTNLMEKYNWQIDVIANFSDHLQAIYPSIIYHSPGILVIRL